MATRPVFLQRLILLTIVLTGLVVFLIVPAAATLQGLQVGMDAPSFALPNTSGENSELSELMGERLTVVVFWSTWSKKSRQTLIHAQQLWDQYHEQGLAVIGINADGQTISQAVLTDIDALAAELQISFPILIDHGLATFHEYGVIAFPTTVVIDADRLIRYELSGYPLVGAAGLKDFVLATLEGQSKRPETVIPAYLANKKAQRLFHMGRNTLQSGRMAATAEVWFKKAIDADPLFVAPHLALGRYYQKHGEFKKAQDQFEQTLLKEPGNAVALCEGGMLQFNSGEREEGRARLEKAVTSGVTYAPCYYHLGPIYGLEGKLDKAASLFAQAKEINPLDVELYSAEGAMYEELQQMDKAASAYREALEVVLSIQ